ncbi:MAG: UDP-N-acetylmuramoyl-tripeptide--D-alanyl-D-alanine ligase [Patescibacteria group bacterium]
MKSSLNKILKFKLKKLAELTIWRFRPGIIGVTGSVGKTSTKMAIATILSSERDIRFASGNFNNEIGLPFTIISSESKIGGVFFWFKILVFAAFNLLAPKKWMRQRYPELLILEYAADNPGDIKYLLGVARPNISVITAIGDIPVHVEFFTGPEEVAREKARLIEYLPAAGFAVLNYDDETVMNLKDRTRAHIMTFGFGKGADVRISNFETRAEGERPIGISFKLEYGGSFVPVRLAGVFGKTQAYAAASGACVGLIFGMNLVKISEALKNYRPASGRMELMAGIKYTHILNDSYNASPLSMHAALDTLVDLPASRRVAILGDMTEIGKYTLEAHEKIGRIASNSVDVLVTIGPRAKFIAEAARKNGLRKNNIYVFDRVEDALKPVQNLIRKGDLILIKASHIMQLEKMVEEIKAF